MTVGGELLTFCSGWACGITDRGVVRSRNEDNYVIDEDLGLLVVADGMGGHAGGDVASAEALDALRVHLRAAVMPPPATTAVDEEDDENKDSDRTHPDSALPALSTLYQAIETVNQHVFVINQHKGYQADGGMGTTLVGLWCLSDQGPLLAFHVGDSRLYRLRGGHLTQLTRDHSLYQAALDAGAVDNLPKRNILLQAIGPSAEIRPEVQSLDIQPGDRYLLCSDGVHGPLELHDIEEALRSSLVEGPNAACHALLRLAFSRGSTDNATVVLAGLDGP